MSNIHIMTPIFSLNDRVSSVKGMILPSRSAPVDR